MEEISFSCQPHNTNKEIQSLYHELLSSDDKLTLRPSYQRNQVWVNDQKSYLIDTIMTQCPMPIFLLYMFEEKECIDGQNRLSTIKEYIEQDGTKPFPWIIEKEDGEEYVYYLNKETMVHLQSYCDEQNKRKRKKITYRLMTPEETKRFNQYEVTISQIKTKLSFNQRKQIFMRWQNGTSISQCDGFKNESYHYCEYVTEHSLDRELTDRISSLLKSDKNNWLWDIYRLFNVFQTEKVEHVMLSSIQTRTLIQKNTSTSYEKSHRSLESLLPKMMPLQAFKSSMYLSFLLGYIFIWIPLSVEDKNIAEKEEFLIEFAKDSLATDEHNHSTLNNGKNTKDFIQSFPDFNKMFHTYIDKHRPKKKVNIPSVVKTDVWNKYIGKEKGEGECFCCRKKNISARDFHAGHVIPEKENGKATVENLRPICAPCNLSMKTTNMLDFIKNHYPN